MLVALGVLAVSQALAADPPPAPTADAQGLELFERKIRPVLTERCFSCHSHQAKKLRGGLLLDSREAARKGGETGAAVVPGDVEGSLLLSAIRYKDLEMPPDGKLPDEVVAEFENWIRLGAPDPRDETAAPPPSEPKKIDIAAGRQFWSFQPPREHSLPAVHKPDWPRRRIDSFLLASMEAAGLEPSPPADRATLIRRVSYDLLGLPPSPEEVETFVAETAPGAYERLVERLLASPRYGERLARMWLDLARYAEDQAHIVGSDRSLCYPNAYLYRDWVVKALNEDLPYDKFIQLQLAADSIEPDNAGQHAALGFLGLGPKYYGRNSLAVQADEWEDRVDTVSRGLLGLTIACARCHDHKFDPIATEDYYALAGVFASTEMFNRPLADGQEKNEGGQAKKPEQAMHIVREGTPKDLNVFVRGNVENEGPVAPRRFVQVLCAGEPAKFTAGSGRRELAEAITAPENPLTARVMVNRVWATVFGRPLVATESNFGANGERPTHPELLDDLAVQFMRRGWSLKWLQRELVLSAAYQQSSRAEPSKLQADAENRWLAHMNRRRLSVEEWRDSVLCAAGRLDTGLGGPSLDPLDPAQTRRTLYSEVSRLQLNRMLALFDYPDPNMHSDRRFETTTPLQKLFVMNDPFMGEQAKFLAERACTHVATAGPPVPDAAEENECDKRRVAWAYKALLGRQPSDKERDVALGYLCRGESEGSMHQQRWQHYAHVLLALNELWFID